MTGFLNGLSVLSLRLGFKGYRFDGREGALVKIMINGFLAWGATGPVRLDFGGNSTSWCCNQTIHLSNSPSEI